MSDVNKPMIMIMGDMGAGKSVSMRNIPNQERWAYGNTDAGKPIPFRHNFKQRNINNSQVVPSFINAANASPNIDGIILDTVTMLMDLNHLETTQDEDIVGFDVWTTYDSYLKSLFLQQIGGLTKPLIITAHVKDVIVEGSARPISVVPVKGQNKNIGIEAYATMVLHAKKVPIEKVEEYYEEGASPLLTVTDADRRRGYKHVFQTRSTANSMHERMRSPFEFFDDMTEVFLDNDIFKVLQRWDEYYGTSYTKPKESAEA